MTRASEKEARRQLAIANAKQPHVLARVPREQWPVGATVFERQPIEVWRSNRFLVQVHAEAGAVRMSVCRTELGADGRWQDKITWDDLQQIKREVGRADKWAVEIYPADADLVNVANMRHLWILPEAPSFGWRVTKEEVMP
jgi:hypothetical protein